jgi:hypothetical protein
MTTQLAFWPDIGPTSPDGETCETLAPTICPAPIFSAAASPARTSATPESAPGWRVSVAAYGASSPALLASYDPATCSWRTSQRSLDGDLAMFSETWPRSGLMRNGIAYRLPPLVPRISGTGYSWWHTPTAHDAHSISRSQDGWEKRKAFRQAIGRNHIAPAGLHEQVQLREAGMPMDLRLWPIPRHSDAERGGRGDLIQAVRGNPNSHYKLWPTATARDWRSGKASSTTHAKNSRPLNEVVAQGQASGALNPMWVEWLMGFPLGWTDLED